LTGGRRWGPLRGQHPFHRFTRPRNRPAAIPRNRDSSSCSTVRAVDSRDRVSRLLRRAPKAARQCRSVCGWAQAARRAKPPTSIRAATYRRVRDSPTTRARGAAAGATRSANRGFVWAGISFAPDGRALTFIATGWVADGRADDDSSRQTALPSGAGRSVHTEGPATADREDPRVPRSPGPLRLPITPRRLMPAIGGPCVDAQSARYGTRFAAAVVFGGRFF